MANKNLSAAKRAKNDEFYTQYADIQKEVNAYLNYNPDVFRDKVILLPCDDPEWSNFTKFFAQNFERFGIKKLVSTSYACASKGKDACADYCPTLFECKSEKFNKDKTETNGKIFTLTRDTNNNGRIDIDDLEWQYLDGDGDFRSDEIKKLRDTADIIVTNPPFSLFRQFLGWITETNKQFLIIGNMNAITYKEVFPLIKANKMWVGYTPITGSRWFEVKGQCNNKFMQIINNKQMVPIKAVWFTNLEHGRRHQPLHLMTMAENIKFSKHKEIRNIGYQKYDNYDAIEVPYTDAISSDYTEIMGVPISFIDKYCPEQFEILGATESEGRGFSNGLWNSDSGISQATVNHKKVYKRIFIRKKKGIQ